jgi:hypothetical protein
VSDGVGLARRRRRLFVQIAFVLFIFSPNILVKTLACAQIIPASGYESACFIDPNSITGTGQLSLRVNTTPAHPVSKDRVSAAGWLTAGGGASLACMFLFAVPRRRWRGRAMFVLKPA